MGVAPVLDTTSVSSGANFDSQQISALPMFSNMPVGLARFAPGVNPDPEADTDYDGPDNIALDPNGGLILAEDGDGIQHLDGTIGHPLLTPADGDEGRIPVDGQRAGYTPSRHVRQEGPVARELPQPGGIPRNRQEVPAVGAERHGAHPAPVAPEGVQRQAGDRVPDPGRTVHAGRGEPAAVGAEGHAGHGTRVAFQCKPLLARGQVPDRVPVEVRVPLVRELHVREAADRVHEEAERVPPVEVGVEPERPKLHQAQELVAEQRAAGEARRVPPRRRSIIGDRHESTGHALRTRADGFIQLRVSG